MRTSSHHPGHRFSENLENLIHVQYGPHESWSERSSEQHQLIVLLEPKHKAQFSWHLPGGKKRQVTLTGRHVLFIEKQVPTALCVDNQAAVVSLNFSDDFIAELAPGASWKGVLIKTWREVSKQDILIRTFWEDFQRMCQSEKTEISDTIAHALGLLLATHLLRATRQKGAFPDENSPSSV